MADEPLIDVNHVPSYSFKEGHFYCDGIRVQPSQLTQEEVMKYIPAKFQSTFLKAINPGVTSNDRKK